MAVALHEILARSSVGDFRIRTSNAAEGVTLPVT